MHLLRSAWAVLIILVCTRSTDAQLVFEPPNIDLGEAKAGQVFAQQVKVTNQGRESITISEIKSSCGCIQPVLEPATLAPGATGILKLQINTLTSSPGPTTYGLRLRFTDQGQLRELQYILTCRVVQELVVTPASITFIGERPRPQTITILDKRSTPIRPVKLEASSPFLQVEWIQPAQAEPQPQYALHLTVREGLEPRQYDEEIIIHTSDQAYPVLRIPIKIVKKAKARYVASPILVSLSPSVAPSRQVTIRDQQGEAVSIERFEVTQGLVVSITNQATASVTLNVALDPNNKREGPFDAEVRAYLKGQPTPVKVLVNVE